MGQGIENTIADLEKKTPHGVYYLLKYSHISFSLPPGIKLQTITLSPVTFLCKMCCRRQIFLNQPEPLTLTPLEFSCSELRPLHSVVLYVKWICICSHFKFQYFVLSYLIRTPLHDGLDFKQKYMCIYLLTIRKEKVVCFLYRSSEA